MFNSARKIKPGKVRARSRFLGLASGALLSLALVPAAAQATPTFSFATGSFGSGNGQLFYPQGLTVDPEGNVLVVDRENQRVEKFNSAGEYAGQFGSYGTGNGEFAGPEDVAMDPEGDIWVTDWANSRIQQFDGEGQYLSQIAVSLPNGITVDPEGNIFVTSWYNGLLYKFDQSGKDLGVGWVAPTKFGYRPSDVAVDSQGDVWTADPQNHKVFEFTGNGFLKAEIGGEGSGDGQMYGPWGLAIDNEDNVYVADSDNMRIQIFDGEGNYVDKFGSEGSGEGQFYNPMALAIDAMSGDIWVSDSNNHRIHNWTP